MTLQEHTTIPLIETLEQSISKTSPLHMKAWDAFLKEGLPSPKHEAFKYFKLGGLYQKSWPTQPIELDKDWIQRQVSALSAKNVLVTYNGFFLKDYSSYPDFEKNLIILPFSEAIKSYSSFFTRYYEKQLGLEKDPFAKLSLATWKDGLFIYVPKNVQMKAELTLLELSSGNKAQSYSQVTLVSLGAASELKLSSISQSSNQAQMLSLAYKGFQIDQGARLEHTHATSSSESYHFEATRAELMRNAHFRQTLGVSSTPKSRHSVHVQLMQEGAEVDLSGLLALKEKEQGHVHVLVEHNAPHCFSSQLFKHLLGDEALSSFEGKIDVKEIAQKTNAYQLNQNCLLSSKAQAYSKPNLEIFADDVKASHGSTTGQIDKEQLFYLLSRGLSKAQAQQILLKGFCDEVLFKSQHMVAKQVIEKDLSSYLKEAL